MSDAPERTDFDQLVARLRSVENGLRASLQSLYEKTSIFYSENEVLGGLDSFKVDAESRATDLETEVSELREELRAIRDFLGLDKKHTTNVKSS